MCPDVQRYTGYLTRVMPLAPLAEMAIHLYFIFLICTWVFKKSIWKHAGGSD